MAIDYNSLNANTGYDTGSPFRLAIRRLKLCRCQLRLLSMASAAPGHSPRPVTAFRKYRQDIYMDPDHLLLRSLSGWIPLLSLLLQTVFCRTGNSFSGSQTAWCSFLRHCCCTEAFRQAGMHEVLPPSSGCKRSRHVTFPWWCDPDRSFWSTWNIHPEQEAFFLFVSALCTSAKSLQPLFHIQMKERFFRTHSISRP